MSRLIAAMYGGGIARGRLMEERKSWWKNHPHGFVVRLDTLPDGNMNLMSWRCIIPEKLEVHNLKKDIGLFSGFVWIENEGSGTLLKDIPNVAYKLSKRKPDDNLQLLHTILFGKKAKVHNLKKDIGLFSGFVWIENEVKIS